MIEGIVNGTTYDIGQTLSINISAKTGFVIKSVTWEGETQAITDNKYFVANLTVTSNATISVVYEAEHYASTVINNSSQGTITGINNGSNYEYGTSLNITITAKDEYKIKSITLNGNNISITNSSVMTITHVVDSEINISVVYEKETTSCRVTLQNNNSRGTVTGVTSTNYDKNTKLTITVVAKDGYEIKSIKFGGKNIRVSNPGKTSFTETLTEDVTIQITYQEVEQSSESGSGCSMSMNAPYVGVIALVLAITGLVALKLVKKEN